MGKGKKDSKQTKVGGKYSRQTSRGLYIGKYHLPPWGGGISADVIGEKIWKGEEKKEENVKEKGRKGKEN
jgi:hypothetical protein